MSKNTQKPNQTWVDGYFKQIVRKEDDFTWRHGQDANARIPCYCTIQFYTVLYYSMLYCIISALPVHPDRRTGDGTILTNEVLQIIHSGVP